MRASAILIGILALGLASCGVEPQVRENSHDALSKLKGPDTGSIDSTLLVQAQQATAVGDFRQAAELYKQMVDQKPDNMGYQMGYAESLRRAGACPASLKVTDTIVAKEPRNAAALENKGLCLMNTGEFSEAGTVLGQVMKIDDKRWRTLNAIGILFTMKGKYDGAVAYYQAALNISTDNPSVLNNAALTYAIDRQFDRSYDAFSRAKRHVQPGSADMKHLDLNLALVYAVNGKLDLAEQTATPYLTKEGLYNNMGFYSYLAKNNDLAKGYLNMALTQSPTYYERAWKNLGALTGDPGAGTGQPLPTAMPGNGASGALPVPGVSGSEAVPVPVSQSAAVSLDEIPESKGMSTLVTPKAKAVTTKVAAAAAPTATMAAAPESSPPADNPDVIILHKPVPDHNGDWDANKGGDASSAAPAAGN